MTIADELRDFYETEPEFLIKEPLKFKAMLGIGERAYGWLRAREHMTTFSEALGMGGAASAAASSSMVATTFFAPTGIAGVLSSIGIGAAAATPIGWVIAAGVVTGTAWLGVSRLLERAKDEGLIIIPKYINTPLDLIAQSLIQLMLPISLKIARSDGQICDAERDVILGHFVNDWGYNPDLVKRLCLDYEAHLETVSYDTLVDQLKIYCATNPDCDHKIIRDRFIEHLAQIIEADADIKVQERKQLELLRHALTPQTSKLGPAKAIGNVTEKISNAASKATKTIAEAASKVRR